MHNFFFLRNHTFINFILWSIRCLKHLTTNRRRMWKPGILVKLAGSRLSCGEGDGTPLSTLAWKIPWTEEPGGLQSMGSLRVGHDRVTSLSLFTFMHWRRKWHPTPVFLPGESQGRGSLVGCRLWGRTESDATEATAAQAFLSAEMSLWLGVDYVEVFISLCRNVIKNLLALSSGTVIWKIKGNFLEKESADWGLKSRVSQICGPAPCVDRAP